VSDRFEIETSSGWRGELRIVDNGDDTYMHMVKVALYLRKGWLSPFFEVDRFCTHAEATSYAIGIKKAIEGES
jgi:hypothetical protein